MQTHRIKTGMIMILGWAMGSHLGFATSTADLPTELDKLDTLRNGKDTQYDVVESTGERLLQEYPKDDDRRQIYAELADIYEQCGVAHPERITKYATAAISLSADSLEIGHLYVDLGDAVQVQFSQTDGQAFLAARKLAAREYLKGLSAIEKVNAPEKIDPSRVRDTSGVPELHCRYTICSGPTLTRRSTWQR